MPGTKARRRAIHSNLAGDPVLREMVELFVADLPQRLSRLQRHFEDGDREALQRAAHQLKGSLASYGFHPLIGHADRLETLVLEQSDNERLAAAIRELAAHCNRATAEQAPSRSAR